MQNKQATVVSGLFFLAAVALLSFWPSPAQSDRGRQPDGEEPEAFVIPVKRWTFWDETIDRRYLGSYISLHQFQPLDPWGEYLDAVTYDAPPDSIGLEEFRRMTGAERRARKRLASDYRQQAVRFEGVINEIVQRFQEAPNDPQVIVGRPKGIFESVTRLIKHLVIANGIDPSSPVSWYDQAYFCGIVGDSARQRQCLDAALAAIADDLTGRYLDYRHRIALDYAWLCRDSGEWDRALGWIDRAERLQEEDTESILIRGLVLAEKGQAAEACRLGARIRSIPAHRLNWGQGLTDFAERWIQSLAYRQKDQMPLACFALGRVHGLSKIPFAHRYYRDVGMMCELNGQPNDALYFYSLSTVHNPYSLYYPISSFVGPTTIHGQDGTGIGYSMAYEHFYVSGSLFSFAAQQVLAVESALSDLTRQELATEAIEALNTCRRRNIRPTSALALRGRIYYYLDDMENALADLRQACREMIEQNVADAKTFSLAGLLSIEQGEYSQAVPLLQRALEIDPEMPYAWRAAAVALIGDGEFEVGRRVLDRAVVIDPASAVGWYNRGLLNYHQRKWTEACADLERAGQLAPGDDRISSLLARAEKARGQFASEPATASGQPDSAVTVASAVPVRDEDLWRETFPKEFFHDARSGDEGVKALYELDLNDRLGKQRTDVQASWLNISPSDLQRIVAALEEEYRSNPSRSVRLDLAMAYVRAGKHAAGRDLLLPSWDDGIEPAEICVVLEADRALGDAIRARQLAGTLSTGQPEPRDATVWSLVSFICLDSGLNEEGLAALEAAIVCDPGNLSLRSQREILIRHQ